MAHTKPPWSAVELDDGSARVIGDGRVVARCESFDPFGQDMVNAALIAAAPDLLEALQDLEAAVYRLNGSDTLPGWLSGYVVNARAAIAKANNRRE